MFQLSFDKEIILLKRSLKANQYFLLPIIVNLQVAALLYHIFQLYQVDFPIVCIELCLFRQSLDCRAKDLVDTQRAQILLGFLKPIHLLEIQHDERKLHSFARTIQINNCQIKEQQSWLFFSILQGCQQNMKIHSDF
ncbi:transmembrane protein, putative (macronuclear) [Tetrahymena thermophila SB210]|uniref:Transmembrane protein, putative n=1 Tax=Tetrahymena thermophila (strain SB210) TaxID=312017 RepID=W7XA50_TETTS|nr:transmembrane protein, putative [Tetrahymena thermophila SB210]EWS73278.1 transmembrane protein, putative [Tetrahymena thermophila SB210]|eukprot:XP_012654187.1 transmembrane protein, putative [Tetrahymena thermophila SB210]